MAKQSLDLNYPPKEEGNISAAQERQRLITDMLKIYLPICFKEVDNCTGSGCCNEGSGIKRESNNGINLKQEDKS